MFRGLIKRIQDAQAEREAKRLELQAFQEAERRRLEEQALKRRQWQQNILTILEEDKLPDLDWDELIGLPLPFRFMKSEHLIYVFPDVGYAEMRVKREIVGRSAGTSVRVAKGVYARVGASRGTPVEKDEIVERGVGTLAVTTKHLYFNGQRSFRIRFDKIVSVEPMRDGVTVTRDRASALPEYFIVGEQASSFAYDLLQVVPALELGRGVPDRQSPDEYHLLVHGGADYIFEDSV